MKDLHTENWKTVMKESEADINKWKCVSCIGRLSTVKMFILPKVT